MSTFSSSNFNSVFTTLSTALKTELDLQFTNRRIIGSEYANAYTQLMDTVLKLAYGDQQAQASIELTGAQVAAQNADASFKAEQGADLTAKRQPSIDLMNAQKEVYVRQKTGFDDNAKQKLMEVQLNSWGLAFSSGMLDIVPDVIKNKNLTVLYADAITKYGLTVSTIPETPIPAT